MSDHPPACPAGCCQRVRELREKENARSRARSARNPETARARWQRYNRKRPGKALGGPSGPLPPTIPIEGHSEGPEASEGS